MKKLTLALVTLLTVACGGAPFSATTDALGGDAGAPDILEAGAPSASRSGAPTQGGGGSSATAGTSTAGKPTSGGAPSGGAGAGGAGGAPVSTCDFDEAKLTSALPKSFVWQDFIYTNGEFCVTCRDTPCDTVNVISWGVPVAGENENEFIYYPNTDKPMVSVELGANDGACTAEKSCGAKLDMSTVKIVTERSGSGWSVTIVEVSAGGGSTCLAMDPHGSGAGIAIGTDFGKEVSAVIQDIEIPCN